MSKKLLQILTIAAVGSFCFNSEILAMNAAEQTAIDRKIDLCNQRCALTGQTVKKGDDDLPQTIIDKMVKLCKDNCKSAPYHCQWGLGGKTVPCENANQFHMENDVSKLHNQNK